MTALSLALMLGGPERIFRPEAIAPIARSLLFAPPAARRAFTIVLSIG
jgi:hypothetical protein